MVEYTTPCPSCSELRKVFRSVDCSDLPQGVAIIGSIPDSDAQDDQSDHHLCDLMIQCKRCNSTGLLLTAEGRALAQLIGLSLKGTVIV